MFFFSCIACPLNGFTSANSGTITLTGMTTGASCLYVIAPQVPIANVRVTCTTITLGAAAAPAGIVSVSLYSFLL